MVGKPNERVTNIFLGFFFISTAFMITACARHKILIEKVPPQEKRVERRGVYHRVEKHQTLYRICRTYGVDIQEVVTLNGVTDPSRIHTGQRVFIPGAKKTLKVEIYIDDVAAESGEKGKIVSTGLNFIWPVEGKISDVFSDTESKRHQGIDIPLPSGTPIKASSSGTVIYSSNTIKGYGNLIILRHSEEFVTVYAHNQTNMDEEASWVERGQIIGKVGQTGRATGPHLHFEIRRNNKAVDPLPYLK
jgi:murein DD-endopeptidase MepM/ murein hydrolase activator NlpD